MTAKVDLRRLSVANLTAGRVDPIDFIAAAATAGFGAVGLLLTSATATPLAHEIIGRPHVIRAIQSALAAHGMRVFDVEAFILSPRSNLTHMRRVMEVGAALGATHLSAIGTEFAGHTDFLGAAERIDLFGRLCDAAASFGLHVGVECMRYRDIRTWKDALALIQAADRSNAGLIMDFLHLHRAGSTAAALATIPAKRIAYAQLCDAAAISPDVADLAAEARGNRLYPGEGVIDLQGLMAALPENTPLVVETPVARNMHLPLDARLAAAADAFTRYFQRS